MSLSRTESSAFPSDSSDSEPIVVNATPEESQALLEGHEELDAPVEAATEAAPDAPEASKETLESFAESIRQDINIILHELPVVREEVAFIKQQLASLEERLAAHTHMDEVSGAETE